MPTWRPSTVINLRLRFDKALTLLPEDQNPETVQSRLDNPPAKPGTRSTKPLALESSPNESWILARIPLSLSIDESGYRMAGKFTATLDYRDLPIDPRTIAAAAIEIHTGVVSAEDFGAGYRGRDDRGQLQSILQTRTEDGQINASTLRMYGIVDNWEVTHDGEGSLVEIDGRDLRGVLIDFPIAPVGVSTTQFWDSIDTKTTIDKVVVQMLSFNPLFDDLNVIVNAEDWPDGEIAVVGVDDFVPRHRKGAKGNRSGRATPPSTSSGNAMSFWDAIVRVCFLVGAIPYFKNQELHIRPASTIFDKLRGPIDPQRNPTPFASNEARIFDQVSGTPINPGLRVRRMVYGRDINSVTFQRKLGGKKRPTVVRTVSINPESGAKGAAKTVVGVWPPETAKVAQGTRQPAGKGKSASEVITIPVPYVKDPTRLTEIARSLYEELGRSEMGGSIETTNLASFGGVDDADLLRLKPGDGVEIMIDSRAGRVGAPFGSSYTDSVRRPFEDQVREITRRLGDENLARAIVATARGQVLELQRFFRVETTRFSWSHTEGVKVAFEFQNYVVVTNQVEESSPRIGAADASTTPNNNLPTPSGRSLRNL